MTTRLEFLHRLSESLVPLAVQVRVPLKPLVIICRDIYIYMYTIRNKKGGAIIGLPKQGPLMPRGVTTLTIVHQEEFCIQERIFFVRRHKFSQKRRSLSPKKFDNILVVKIRFPRDWPLSA